MNQKKVQIFGCAVVSALWLVLTGVAWFSPEKDISEAERRKLEQFPQVSAQSVADGSFMSKFETYTQDQFPLRDGFRRAKAGFNRWVLRNRDNNGIYLADGYAAKLEYPLNEVSLRGAVKKFQKIYDSYLQQSNHIVFAVVPDKGYYLAEKNGYPAMDYSRVFETVQGLDWAEYADLTQSLNLDSYYRTDTHWRQEKLVPAAQVITRALGAEMLEGCAAVPVERPFYGVYYGQAALPMNSETMYTMDSDVLRSCTVTNHETGTTAGVYDMEKLSSRDLYDIYLSGPVSLLTIENPSAARQRELVVFRDSFGSSLIPLLVESYSKITVVDIRYIPTAALEELVEFTGSDILFLYSTLVLNNSAMLK